MTPAPSLRTKPSRFLSKGREALVGSSLRVESAFMAAKPLRPSPTTAASLPPATMMSASSSRIRRQASPMEWLAVAQAETMAKLGPRRPYCMEICPDAILLIIIGIMNGETFLGPRSRRMECCSSSVRRPPMPEPTRTPARSASKEPSWRPQSFHASAAAPMARWV